MLLFTTCWCKSVLVPACGKGTQHCYIMAALDICAT